MRNEQTRTLYLPHGGTLEIPLPGSKARFSINPATALAESDGSSRLPSIMIGVVIGVAIGAAAAAWYFKK